MLYGEDRNLLELHSKSDKQIAEELFYQELEKEVRVYVICQENLDLMEEQIALVEQAHLETIRTPDREKWMPKATVPTFTEIRDWFMASIADILCGKAYEYVTGFILDGSAEGDDYMSLYGGNVEEIAVDIESELMNDIATDFSDEVLLWLVGKTGLSIELDDASTDIMLPTTGYHIYYNDAQESMFPELAIQDAMAIFGNNVARLGTGNQDDYDVDFLRITYCKE